MTKPFLIGNNLDPKNSLMGSQEKIKEIEKSLFKNNKKVKTQAERFEKEKTELIKSFSYPKQFLYKSMEKHGILEKLKDRRDIKNQLKKAEKKLTLAEYVVEKFKDAVTHLLIQAGFITEGVMSGIYNKIQKAWKWVCDILNTKILNPIKDLYDESKNVINDKNGGKEALLYIYISAILGLMIVGSIFVICVSIISIIFSVIGFSGFIATILAGMIGSKIALFLLKNRQPGRIEPYASMYPKAYEDIEYVYKTYNKTKSLIISTKNLTKSGKILVSEVSLATADQESGNNYRFKMISGALYRFLKPLYFFIRKVRSF